MLGSKRQFSDFRLFFEESDHTSHYDLATPLSGDFTTPHPRWNTFVEDFSDASKEEDVHSNQNGTKSFMKRKGMLNSTGSPKGAKSCGLQPERHSKGTAQKFESSSRLRYDSPSKSPNFSANIADSFSSKKYQNMHLSQNLCAAGASKQSESALPHKQLAIKSRVLPVQNSSEDESEFCNIFSQNYLSAFRLPVLNNCTVSVPTTKLVSESNMPSAELGADSVYSGSQSSAQTDENGFDEKKYLTDAVFDGEAITMHQNPKEEHFAKAPVLPRYLNQEDKSTDFVALGKPSKYIATNSMCMPESAENADISEPDSDEQMPTVLIKRNIPNKSCTLMLSSSPSCQKYHPSQSNACILEQGLTRDVYDENTIQSFEQSNMKARDTRDRPGLLHREDCRQPNSSCSTEEILEPSIKTRKSMVLGTGSSMQGRRCNEALEQNHAVLSQLGSHNVLKRVEGETSFGLLRSNRVKPVNRQPILSKTVNTKEIESIDDPSTFNLSLYRKKHKSLRSNASTDMPSLILDEALETAYASCSGDEVRINISKLKVNDIHSASESLLWQGSKRCRYEVASSTCQHGRFTQQISTIIQEDEHASQLSAGHGSETSTRPVRQTLAIFHQKGVIDENHAFQFATKARSRRNEGLKRAANLIAKGKSKSSIPASLGFLPRYRARSLLKSGDLQTVGILTMPNDRSKESDSDSETSKGSDMDHGGKENQSDSSNVCEGGLRREMRCTAFGIRGSEMQLDEQPTNDGRVVMQPVAEWRSHSLRGFASPRSKKQQDGILMVEDVYAEKDASGQILRDQSWREKYQTNRGLMRASHGSEEQLYPQISLSSLFTTGMGNTMQLSSESLRRARDLFADLSPQLCPEGLPETLSQVSGLGKCNGESMFHSPNNCAKSVGKRSQEVDTKKMALRIEQTVTWSEEEKKLSRKTEGVFLPSSKIAEVLEGQEEQRPSFITGSGKFVRCSTESLKRAADLFADLRGNNSRESTLQNISDDVTSKQASRLADYSGNVKKLVDAIGLHISTEWNEETSGEGQNNITVNFETAQTATSHQWKATSGAVKDVGMISSGNGELQNDHSQQISFFKTGAGKFMHLTRKSLQRAAGLFADLGPETSNGENENQSCGNSSSSPSVAESNGESVLQTISLNIATSFVVESSKERENRNRIQVDVLGANENQMRVGTVMEQANVSSETSETLGGQTCSTETRMDVHTSRKDLPYAPASSAGLEGTSLRDPCPQGMSKGDAPGAAHYDSDVTQIMSATGLQNSKSHPIAIGGKLIEGQGSMLTFTDEGGSNQAVEYIEGLPGGEGQRASLFFTGSGKKVHFSSDGLKRAAGLFADMSEEISMSTNSETVHEVAMPRQASRMANRKENAPAISNELCDSEASSERLKNAAELFVDSRSEDLQNASFIDIVSTQTSRLAEWNSNVAELESTAKPKFFNGAAELNEERAKLQQDEVLLTKDQRQETASSVNSIQKASKSGMDGLALFETERLPGNQIQVSSLFVRETNLKGADVRVERLQSESWVDMPGKVASIQNLRVTDFNESLAEPLRPTESQISKRISEPSGESSDHQQQAMPPAKSEGWEVANSQTGEGSNFQKVGMSSFETENLPDGPELRGSLFVTGTGKRVHLSSNSLKRAAGLFADVRVQSLSSASSEKMDELIATNEVSSVANHSRRVAELSSLDTFQNHKRSKQLSEERSNDQREEGLGIKYNVPESKTASMENVDRFERPEKVGMTSSDIRGLPDDDGPRTSLFVTGTGKSVHLSKDSLKRAAGLFIDIKAGNLTRATLEDMPGTLASSSQASDMVVCKGDMLQVVSPTEDHNTSESAEPIREKTKYPQEETLNTKILSVDNEKIHSWSNGVEKGEVGVKSFETQGLLDGHGQRSSFFVTGTGRNVHLSNESLDRARGLFAEVKEKSLSVVDLNSMPGKSSSSHSSETVLQNMNVAEPTHSKNWHDGKGTTVSTLQDWQKRNYESSIMMREGEGTQAVEGCDKTQTKDSEIVEATNEGSPGQKSGGSFFVTGTGKSVRLSSESLKRARGLFADMSTESSTVASSPSMISPIRISKLANRNENSDELVSQTSSSGTGARNKGELRQKTFDYDERTMMRSEDESGKGAAPAVDDSGELSGHGPTSFRSSGAQSSLFVRGNGTSVCLSNECLKRAAGLFTDAREESWSGAATTTSPHLTSPCLSRCAGPEGHQLENVAMKQAEKVLPDRQSHLTNVRGLSDVGCKTDAGMIVGRSNTEASSFVTPRVVRNRSTFNNPDSASTDSVRSGAVTRKVSLRCQSADRSYDLTSPAVLFCTPDLSTTVFRQRKINLREKVLGGYPFEDEGAGSNVPVLSTGVLTVHCENAAQHQLSRENSKIFMTNSSSLGVGVSEMYHMLTSQKAVENVSEAWVENHYKWIVWKFACMEKAFPIFFGGILLNADRVFSQIASRYDLEILQAKRSFLKSLMERDEVATRHVVLCVSAIFNKTSEMETKAADISLTDGWYEIDCLLDDSLKRMIQTGKIFMGLKLRLYGCKLAPSNSPSDKPVLILSVNSCRRAEWDAKLGRQDSSLRLLAGIAGLVPDGGTVPGVSVVVNRVYPMAWMETLPDGTKIWRSTKAEDKAREEFENQQQVSLHDFMQASLQEFESKQASDCEESDSESVDACQEKRRRAFQDACDSCRKEFFQQHAKERKVCAVLRFKAACLKPGRFDNNKMCYITIWRPCDEHVRTIQEGTALEITNLKAGRVRRNGFICLSLDKDSKIRISCISCSNDRYLPRRLWGIDELTSCPAGDEVDVAGILVAASSVQQVSRPDGSSVPRQGLVLCGPGGALLQIAVDLRALTWPSRTLEREGVCLVVCRNLERLSWSAEAGAFKCCANDMSEISADVKPSADDAAATTALDWLTQARDGASLQDARERACRLLGL